MKKIKKLLFLLITFSLLFVISAEAKTYSASKVTSKQIVKELKKSFKIHKVVNYTSKTNELIGEPNYYRSKTDFYDKKYNKYCTVEVFEDNWDAATRVAELRFYKVIHNTDSTNMYIYRVKNVVLRVTNAMPKSYGIKYYKTLKAMIK